MTKDSAPVLRAHSRSRLNEKLARLWDHRLGLVVAPPGSGKSTLLMQFAEAGPAETRHHARVPHRPGDLEAITADAQDRPVRSTRRLRLAVAVLASVVLSGGIGYYAGTSSQEGVVDTPATTPPTSVLTAPPGDVSHVSLVLGQGNTGAAEWEFPATNPKKYALTVTANLTPSDSDITFAVRVTGGRTLNIGQTTDDQSCQGGTAHEICTFRLELLDAEAPGTWVLRLEKRSSGDAQVSTTISFDNP